MKKIVKVGFPILCVVVVGGGLIALNDASNKAKFIKEQREKENKTNTSYNTNIDDNEFLNNNISSNSVNTAQNNSVDSSIQNNNSNTNIVNNGNTNNSVVYSVPVN